MEDVMAIMNLNKAILLSGLEDTPIRESDIASAKEAAKRLEEKGFFKFNLEGDNIAFFESVCQFARSFFKD